MIGVLGILVIVVLGFVALGVDVGHLYLVRNELQNAADAGALAGANVLYSENGTQVNPNANQAAFDAAVSNRVTVFPAGWSPVQVDWPSGTNDGGVQRGHYDPSTGVFTSNASLEPVDLQNGAESSLNADTTFVNAVRVITRTSTRSLFAGLLGVSTSNLSAEAVAYLGFARELNPRDVDQPIAVCQDWLYPADSSRNPCNNYPNSSYWMVPDGPHQVVRWITLDEGPTSDISCGPILDGNPQQVMFTEAMPTVPISSDPTAFNFFRDQNWRHISRCAMNDSDNDGIRETPIDSNNNTIPDRPWIFTLPVIDCSGNPYSVPPLGRVVVEMIWMTPGGSYPEPDNVCDDTPRRMYDRVSGTDWTCPWYQPGCDDPIQRWSMFAQRFEFRDSTGPTLDCTQPSLRNVMFLKPVCEDDDGDGTYKPVRPRTGRTGSTVYGLRGQLAKYPVLVK